MSTLAFTLSLACATAATQQQPAPQPSAMLVEAATIVVSPDVTIAADSAPGSISGRNAGATILVRGGRVAAVGAEVPTDLGPDVRRQRFEGATLVPGFVIAHGYGGVAGDLAETVDAFTPDLRATDAFDPFGKEIQRLADGGATTLGLAPGSANTFAGLAGAVKTGPHDGMVLQEVCYLKTALVPESLDQQRFPTSRMGALDLMRAAFRTAADPLTESTAECQVLRDVQGGSYPIIVHANTHDEISCALDLIDPARAGVLAGTQARLVVLGALDAGKSIDRLVALRVGVLLDPLSLRSERERLELPARLAGRGVKFAFTAGNAREVRLSAALAVRHGTPRRAALAALTATPAEMLGLADRVGSLLQGRDADFAVFSGDPLDLDSRVLAVFVAGQRIPDREASRSDH